MFSTFRKPRRGAIRSRNRDSNSSGSEQENDDNKDVDDRNGRDGARHLEAIAKFKEKKNKAGRKTFMTESTSNSNNGNDSPVRVRSGASSLLSFGDDEGEDGEVFKVKKSSVSRRIIKQKKAEKKKNPDSNNGNDQDSDAMEANSRKTNVAAVADDELGIRIKDNIPRPVPAQSWTLSGREAEALHMEEEEEDDEDETEERDEEKVKSKESKKEPLRKLLQSGAIPDAAAIHEARKRRQAARERGDLGAGAKDYIPVEKSRDEADKRGRSESDDEDEGRISFTGVRTDASDRQQRQQQLHSTLRRRRTSSDEEDDDRAPDDWEEQQIRKAMGGMQVDAANSQTAVQTNLFADPSFAQSRPRGNKSKLVAFNLQGVRDHLKERLSSLTEVNRRHQSDADRAVDELISSQSEIERLEAKIPDLTERHKFYQDLRGYVTDLVECFNEKIVNIQYLEDKYYKSKSEISASLMERRREDVRDQMLELSAKPGSGAADAAADAARQRRAAEREGRRRRRLQQRVSAARNGTHVDGLSSDEELSTSDEAKRRTARQDIEIQARQVLVDVVEDFASIRGVMARLEGWKECDSESYGDAYVSLCLPKIFAPLVRLQMLFWNPFAEQNDFERMEWFRTLSTFSWDSSETESSLAKDPDRRLVALLVERVVVPKLTSLVEAEFDPMSTSQTLRLTALVNRLAVEYPTLTGFSKTMRALLQAVREKLKSCVDSDLYVPIGYSKQISDNPSGSHAAFANRQFWVCFKLFRNILSWQGLLTDEILSDLALNAVLSRYLLIALGVNPNPSDALAKSKQIVAALPSEWKERGGAREQLKRLANYLATLGNSVTGQKESVNEVFSLLKVIGYGE